jgi:hypothetical protein
MLIVELCSYAPNHLELLEYRFIIVGKYKHVNLDLLFLTVSYDDKSVFQEL